MVGKSISWIPLRLLQSVSPSTRTQYAAVPTDLDLSSPRPWQKRRRHCSCRGLLHAFTLRRLLIGLACILALIFFAILCQGVPPSYDEIRTFERRLPQHAVEALTRTNGHPARYVKFPGYLVGQGVNNVLQEAFLMSYLAYVSNVSFVFEDFTWSNIPLPWAIYEFALRPTRIPINAIISGPTAGGFMPEAPQAPLAVSAEFYEHVCKGPDAPPPYVISSANAPNDEDGSVIIDWWRDQLVGVDEKCIEIDSTAHIVFDRFLFGGPRILSLFDPLISSPILRDFSWSPLVQSAVARNFALLQPPSAKDIFSTSPQSTLHGLLAIHLRRGDYVRHCPNLARWGAHYMGINQLPSLIDRFDPSPYDNDTRAKEAYYLEHCLPTTEQVVKRLREIRESHPGLKRVYVLSNDWSWALSGFKAALQKDGWQDLVSTADIQVDAEQYYVSMAVDMAIAEKAEVFVGNGFSSLSSNVIMLRIAKGMDPASNRFL